MSNAVLDFSEVHFPVIGFKGKEVYFARNVNDIAICSKVGLKNGFYKGLQIVDSKGVVYKIKEAVKVGTVGPFWGYDFLLNQKLRVELVLAKGNAFEIMDINAFKVKTRKAITTSSWSSGGSLKQTKAFIDRAIIHREIIDLLADDFYHEYK